MWTYEKENHRAFVSILGHQYKTFDLPHVRAWCCGASRGRASGPMSTSCANRRNSRPCVIRRRADSPGEGGGKLELHPDFNISLVASDRSSTNRSTSIGMPRAACGSPRRRNIRTAAANRARNAERAVERFRLPRPPAHSDRPAIDRISILTDTDGDGRMDKKVIFYEGLELVTGFVFYKDGVIVVQAPDICGFATPMATARRTRWKNFTRAGQTATRTRHQQPRWGYDGWIYATHGYSASGHVFNGDKSKDFGGIGSAWCASSRTAAPSSNILEGRQHLGMDFGPDNDCFTRSRPAAIW